MMAIRNKIPEGATEMYHVHRRRADQEWDLAGLARQDGDWAAAAQHTEKARKHEALAKEEIVR